jgi:hypothetical protein
MLLRHLEEHSVKKPARWSVAVGTGLLLSLTALTPLSSATAAPAPAHRADLVDVPARALVDRVINPDDYECETPILQQYVTATLLDMTAEQFAFVVAHQGTLLNVPTYEALVYGSDTDPTYALDSHAAQLEKAFRQVKRFWSDVPSDDIQLHAMHGDVLLDADRIARTLAFLAETDVTPQIQAEADTVADFMATQGDFYNNPLWTLNAYAFSGEGDPDPRAQEIPDKLVFGDGFLQAMDDLGFGDVGPRVVMGHEFGHHIQYELGLFDPVASPEATRRTELMADAYAAYFGVHKRGLALNQKRVVDTLQTFYAVGDCAFDNDGHHGTPNQRRRAAEWGADLAQASQPASSKLLASELAELFEAKLPELVAPDA